MRVRVLDGPSAGTEYALQGAVVRLGRSDDNDIVLPDTNASRNHAELVREPSGRYLVRDLGSRNGILVNRKKVPQATLGNGDRVTIGGTTVEFLSPDASVSGSGAGMRWLFVAGAAALLGFLVVSFGGGSGGGTPPRRTGPVVAGAGGTAVAETKDGDGVTIASLFATAQVAPPGNQKGSEVGRNQQTKAVEKLAMVTPLPRTAANEKLIATIMQDGERHYTSGRVVTARDSFERAMKLDPNCERCQSRYESVNKMIQKEVQDALAAGFSYMETERWDQAIMMFDRVKFLEPDPGAMNNATATAYTAEAKQKKAARGR